MSQTSAAADLDPVHEITVNRHPVKIEGHEATGLRIKETAIAQGVTIELGFLLSERIGEHKTRKIRDNEEVVLRSGEEFIATADDDNS
jgi:hypothetical protein